MFILVEEGAEGTREDKYQQSQYQQIKAGRLRVHVKPNQEVRHKVMITAINVVIIRKGYIQRREQNWNGCGKRKKFFLSPQ